jgi:hypothetical protein
MSQEIVQREGTPEISLIILRNDLVESILEFYIGYEHIYKFDIWRSFLGLENKMFDSFKLNYISRQGSILGQKKSVSLKELSRMKKENKLSSLYDQEVLKEVENKFIEEEEQNRTGKGLTKRESYHEFEVH